MAPDELVPSPQKKKNWGNSARIKCPEKPRCRKSSVNATTGFRRILKKKEKDPKSTTKGGEIIDDVGVKILFDSRGET